MDTLWGSLPATSPDRQGGRGKGRGTRGVATARQKCREAVAPGGIWKRQSKVECAGGALPMASTPHGAKGPYSPLFVRFERSLQKLISQYCDVDIAFRTRSVENTVTRLIIY